MPEQVLRIEPDHELKFKGPFNVPSTTLLKIINPSDKRVCFKIKTTAPKRYCVRPNAGLLQPGANANIAVVFQPCELEPTANKHKFMVQALYAPDGDASIDMDSLWKDVDNTKLMDTKLRCTFENAADSGNQNDLNASDEGKITRAKHDDTKSQKDFAVAAAVADTEPTATFVLADDSSAIDSDDMVSDESHGGDAANRLSVHPETVQLRQENGQLKDEIDRLKRQLKSREASGFSGMAMQTNAPATPMLQIILALVVLLVGLVMGKFFV